MKTALGIKGLVGTSVTLAPTWDKVYFRAIGKFVFAAHRWGLKLMIGHKNWPWHQRAGRHKRDWNWRKRHACAFPQFN
jgi:hypothetical protein